MKFIHLTDLHLAPPGRRLYGLDPQARLRAAIADIKINHADADFVLVTGDLAHHGEPAAYEALKDCLSELTQPCHLLIGNHDDRAAFLSAFRGQAANEDGFVQGVVETREGFLILLDTHQPGTHRGQLCARRLAWLEGTLDRLRGRPLFIAMHHPPFSIALPAMDALMLEEHREFTELLARRNNVRHIFFGHVHRPAHGAVAGVAFSTQRGLNHQVAMHSTPQVGIPGNHEPPAYGIVLVDGESLIVHHHDFLDPSPRFDLFDPVAENAGMGAFLFDPP